MSKYLKRNQRGFTLVELLLAMTLFTTVMVISTAGFIAMNRSFTRGTVRRQLSEGVQRTTEDITRMIRTIPQNATAFSCTSGKSDCADGTGYQVLCLAGGRYFWGETGLYRDVAACTDSLNVGQAQELLDTRYRVMRLKITPLKTANSEQVLSGALFQVAGTFTTADQEALNNSNDPETVRCKGSVLSSAVRTCAVERFQTILNARGALK